MLVQLANGEPAILRQLTEEGVVLDCNHPLAGAPLTITVSLKAIEPAEGAAGAAAAQ